MPENIFAKRGKEHQLFKDERFLYPEYVPERLPHRDAEIDSLVYALQPVLKGKKPQNVFVFGKSGTGKTVTVRYILKELEEYSDRAKSLYLNCFEYNTRHSILTAIANFLGEATPRRGIATDEAYVQLTAALDAAQFTPIIVLDETDQLMHNAEASKLFYDLLRIVEHGKNRVALLFISNDFGFTAKLDARVKSSLAEQQLNFESYSPQQLKNILKERSQYAFMPNALETDAINVAAAHAAKLNGDARIAIECLLRAGREAERENAPAVGVKHLQKVFPAIDSRALQKSIDYLSSDEKLILSLIPANRSIASGQLFAQYKKSTKKPLTQRRFRDLISNLESMQLIAAPFTAKGTRGRTRMVELRVAKDAVIRAVEKK